MRSGELRLEVIKVSQDALATVGGGFDGVGGSSGAEPAIAPIGRFCPMMLFGYSQMWTHVKKIPCLVLRRFFFVVSSLSLTLLGGPCRWLPPICAVRSPPALSTTGCTTASLRMDELCFSNSTY